MDYDKLKSLKDYTEHSEITRKEAWADFKHDWSRIFWSLYHAVHVLSGQAVNLVRLCGVEDRNKSQNIGRVVFWLPVALALLLGAQNALATDPPRSSHDQQQSQQAISTSQARSVAKADSRSSATTNNRVDVSGPSVDIKNGGSTAGARAIAGDSSAVGGVANVNGGGAIVSSSYRESIAMAAPIYAGPCSEGFSGSGEDGGFSIQTINQYCQRINQANVMLAAWQFELTHNSEPWCDGICTTKEASVTLKYRQSAKAMEYRDLYYENLDAAQAILDKTETTGLIGRWFQQMGGILIAALLILAV